jgi:hypothetical protein
MKRLATHPPTHTFAEEAQCKFRNKVNSGFGAAAGAALSSRAAVMEALLFAMSVRSTWLPNLGKL